jgi:hypothetical protein
MKFGVFSGHGNGQNHYKFYKQRDIFGLTSQVHGPGAKSCG